MECECEDDTCYFSCTSQHVASKCSKPHKCDECRGTIEPGEKYEITSGAWDGEFMSFRMCTRCLDLKTWMTINVPCFCFYFTQLHSCCRDCAASAAGRAPEEAGHLPEEVRQRLFAISAHNAVRNALTERTPTTSGGL